MILICNCCCSHIHSIEVHLDDCGAQLMATIAFFMDVRQMSPSVQTMLIDGCFAGPQRYYQVYNYRDFSNLGYYGLLSIFIVILMRSLEKATLWYFRKQVFNIDTPPPMPMPMSMPPIANV